MYYENEQPKKSHENEQKAIKNVNEFSDSEEKQVKDRATKRLAEEHEESRRLKIKKRKQKSEENKVKEGQMRNVYTNSMENLRKLDNQRES